MGLCIALLLVACSSRGFEAQLQNYLARLARPLDATAELVTTVIPAPPRAEALQLAIEGSKLDGLDFLRLRGCALQTTVARRNSSLGRIAPPSQQLLLELAFLREAPDCIATLRKEGTDALAALLEESLALKKAQLPALIFNATLAGREYRDFWRSTTIGEDYPAQTSSLVVTALEQISDDAARWLAGDYAADESRLELALAEIARGDGGELLTALAQQSAYLNSADRLIQSRLDEASICSQDRVPDRAAILRTVAQKFFLAEVQATSARLNQRRHLLLGPVTRLEALLGSAFSADYADWLSARDDVLQQGSEAPARHVAALQSLLGSCYAEFAPRAIDTP